MLTGRRAFKGETAADTMTAILTKDPPELDAARLAIPPGLDRIVRRCLEKTPELRFQSANDLAFALETLSTAGSGASSAPPPWPRPRPRRAAARGCRGPWRPPRFWRPRASWVGRGAASDPEARWSSFTRITEAAGEETSPALSPDGGTVAYCDARRTAAGTSIRSASAAAMPRRSSTTRARRTRRGVFAGRVADRVSRVGRRQAASSSRARPAKSVRRVTDNGFDPAWSPDGKQIAFATEEINDPLRALRREPHVGRGRERRHAAEGHGQRRGAAVLVAVWRAPRLLAERRGPARHLHGGRGWRRAVARDHRCRRWTGRRSGRRTAASSTSRATAASR